MLSVLSTAETARVPTGNGFLFIALIFLGAFLLFALFLGLLGFFVYKSYPSKDWFASEKPADWPIVIKAKCKLMDNGKKRWVPVDVIFEEETITIKPANGETLVFPRAETYAGRLPPPYPYRRAAGLATPHQRVDLIHPTSWVIERHRGLYGSPQYRVFTSVLARRLELAQRGSVPEDSIPVQWQGTVFMQDQQEYRERHQ